jgi:dihydrofolate reductase
MKIIQSNAVSLNGLLAREDGSEDWLPSEGWDEFAEDVKKYDNFIMGRETYELVMKLYPNYNFNNVEATHKIIVTTQPDYQASAGYVAIASPEKVVEFLEKENIETGLLIGGGKLNSSFYAKRLINEVWITVNPVILGKGRPFISSLDFEAKLQLINVIKLTKDRVQLRYIVMNG